MSALKVIIAGGGTGGHIFPAVAIGHAIMALRPDAELLFVGANGKMEMEKVPKEGFRIVGLDIAGFNRSNMLKNITLPLKVLNSWMKARSILSSFGAHVVVGVGGYASFPVMYAAQGMKIPTLIQEQNSYAGKANMRLANRASLICVAYDGMDKFFPAHKLLKTGNPVRAAIANMKATGAEGRSAFGLKEGRTTVLVVGGSLGAKSVNEAIDTSLEAILAGDNQLLWQTGKPYYQQALARAAAFGDKVVVQEFITGMALAYAAADVVVSRAGALAVAELCIAAKPVIFVPYPHAAENHQERNAMALVNNGAALMIKDTQVKQELAPMLATLIANGNKRNEMTEKLRAMAVKDAAIRIAEKVIETAGVK
jgi:UDP-N-acetylglucosamine--N-acetylmuramyl-(pentapeptide) pyrophosphoryl-undecaprenol N-acetylglucosamine transferase